MNNIMDELLNKKRDLDDDLKLIQNMINELKKNIVPHGIDIIIDKIRNDENKSLQISELFEELEEINTIVIPNTPISNDDKVQLAKKIYSFVGDDEKEKILEELEKEELDRLHIFDDVLKFFDINFNGSDIKSTNLTTHFFVGKTLDNLKNDLVSKSEFNNGITLKNKINIMATELKTIYEDTTEINKITNKNISETTPVPVTIGTKFKYNIDNTGKISIGGVKYVPQNKPLCIDVIHDFFETIKKISKIIPTPAIQTYEVPFSLNGQNIESVLTLLKYIKKQFEETIPKIIKTYMDKQTGGAFNPIVYKNNLLIPIYIDILSDYLVVVNDRIVELDNQIIELSRYLSNLRNVNDDPSDAQKETPKNASETIKKYLSIAIKSKLTSINNFDMLLIEYLEELNLPTHIMMSIFITPRMSTIQSIIEHNAPDKMFSLYEITRLKKASDFVRFEQNYGYF